MRRWNMSPLIKTRRAIHPTSSFFPIQPAQHALVVQAQFHETEILARSEVAAPPPQCEQPALGRFLR